MDAAASSWRVRTKRIELSRRASISSRFSSPGIPKANRTCSFSRQETRKAAAFMRPGWPTPRFIEGGNPETAGLAEKERGWASRQRRRRLILCDGPAPLRRRARRRALLVIRTSLRAIGTRRRQELFEREPFD